MGLQDTTVKGTKRGGMRKERKGRRRESGAEE